MEARDRLLRSLKGQTVDRVPCICPGGMMNMAIRDLQNAEFCFPEAHTDPTIMAGLACRAADLGLFENLGLPFCMTVEAESYGAPVDLGDEHTEPRVSAYVLERLEDWRDLQRPDLSQGRSGVVLEALRQLRQEKGAFPLIGNLTGPISVATSLIEPSVFYKALRRQNAEAHAFLKQISEDLLRFALAQIEAGAELLTISDPSGTGEILGPRLFREFCVESLNRITRPLLSRGIPCLVHICGRMSAVYPELAELEASALSFDAAVPLRQAREALPGRVLMGNVSTYALEFSSPEKIRQLAEHCVQEGASILAPACGLGLHSPLANVRAILEAARGSGRCQIRLKGSPGILEMNEERWLMDELLAAGCYLENPCSGKGRCGKCKIRVLSPATPLLHQHQPVLDSEAALLTEAEQEAGIRLACCLKAEDGMEVELLQQEGHTDVLQEGLLPVFALDPEADGLGVALDLGTTTLACSLLELRSGNVLARAAAVNPQKMFGLDVLSRISHELETGERGILELQDVIVTALNDLLDQLFGASGAPRHALRTIVTAANPTMSHFLLGRDARPLGSYPYVPAFTAQQELSAQKLGLAVDEAVRLMVLPQVSAFIGADIVAGAAVCRLGEARGRRLFIDIGTNGEIVLSDQGRLLCCSCAAGPALEGMNIRSGMRAEEGAIEEVQFQPEGLILTLIGGGTQARGLCGSGILSAVSGLLNAGLLKSSGTFVKPEELPEGDWRLAYLQSEGGKRSLRLQKEPDIRITQGDIRQVQLAKGAILSGFTALLDTAGLSPESLDEVLIAGQFGAHLPVSSLTGCGMLPETLRHKIRYVGNSSQTGAQIALLSRHERRAMTDLAARMEYLELADTPDYEKRFRDSLRFPECRAESSRS